MLVMLLVFSIVLSLSVTALSNPVTNNGKTYYKVISLDASEDSGDEVCGKAGMICKGYTEPTNAVCKQYHPNAADSTSVSGDSSGVYCNGVPQNGVCSALTDTCHTCPACSVSVQCNQAISGLYREMYVECVSPSTGSGCSVSMTAQDTPSFLTQIPGLNAQLQACPIAVPKGAGVALANGNTDVNIAMNNGQIKSFYLVVKGGFITGIVAGNGPVCTQRAAIMQKDLDSILQSTNKVNQVAFLIGSKKIGISGCKFLTKVKLFFVKPVINFIAKRQAPTPPPPKPAPNCGQVGEQCNNRACWSGICGAPEENINGQWRHVNYRCLDQSDWNAYCQGQGNTPPPWHCLTGPCQ